MSNDEFQFITFENADDFKSRAKRRAVRTHIVKRAVEGKKGHFRNTSTQQPPNARKKLPLNLPVASDRIAAINVEMLDPFESLPVDQSELQALLRHPAAQQAVEPVFSISDPYSFHDFRGAYKNAFADPAFTNALMCAIALAKHNYIFTPDVLHYQGLAIEYINQQLPSVISYECTIGAILLLVGVEWRTGSSDNAQIHLRGIEQLLRLCESEQRALSATVRRGIFWQDVNTAIVCAKDRVMDRAMFPEFDWGRTTFKVDWARLPSGFEDLRGELGDPSTNPAQDIYLTIQDISVLQKHSESLACCKPDIGLIHDIDNMQACIEARIIEQLHMADDNPLRMAVLLTAYLYTYSLFTQIWNGRAIPLHITSRLLGQLQILTCGDLLPPQKPVILWCIFVAGCLTPDGTTHTAYGLLLQTTFGELVSAPSINTSWFATFGMLDQFLWSQPIFGNRALGFLRNNFILLAPIIGVQGPQA